MTTRPTDLPDWASGPTADVVTPSTSKQANGWYHLEPVPNEWVNWFWNRVTQWLSHLSTASSRFESLEAAIEAAAPAGPLAAGDTFILYEDDSDQAAGTLLLNNPFSGVVPVSADATGKSTVSVEPTGTFLWSRDRDGGFIRSYTVTTAITTARAIASDGRYVVVAHDNYLECFDHDTGASQWEYNHGGAVNGVAIGTDHVYMVGADVSNVSVRAISIATGLSSWNYDHGAEVFSVAYVGDQLLIGGAASAHGSAATTRAIEAATGKDAANEGGLGTSALDVIWDSTLGAFTKAGQLVTNGRIVGLRTGTSALRAINLRNAGTVHTFAVADTCTGVAIDHSMIYACDDEGINDGAVYAWDLANGAAIWKWRDSATPRRCGGLVSDGAALWVWGFQSTDSGWKLARGNSPELWRRVDPGISKNLPLRQLAVPAIL